MKLLGEDEYYKFYMNDDIMDCRTYVFFGLDLTVRVKEYFNRRPHLLAVEGYMSSEVRFYELNGNLNSIRELWNVDNYNKPKGLPNI